LDGLPMYAGYTCPAAAAAATIQKRMRSKAEVVCSSGTSKAPLRALVQRLGGQRPSGPAEGPVTWTTAALSPLIQKGRAGFRQACLTAPHLVDLLDDDRVPALQRPVELGLNPVLLLLHVRRDASTAVHLQVAVVALHLRGHERGWDQTAALPAALGSGPSVGRTSADSTGAEGLITQGLAISQRRPATCGRKKGSPGISLRVRLESEPHKQEEAA
jgi:hypothetical protein